MDSFRKLRGTLLESMMTTKVGVLVDFRKEQTVNITGLGFGTPESRYSLFLQQLENLRIQKNIFIFIHE